MTRFARAKGSKASNERITEQATPWTILKQGLLENLSNTKGFQEFNNQKLANYETFLKEKEEEQAKNVTWASFPTQSNNPFLNDKNKVKKSMPENENFTHNNSSNSKTKEIKMKKLKVVTAAEDKVQNGNKNSINSVNLGIKVNVTKKSKVKSKANRKKSTSSVLDKTETEGIPEKALNVTSSQKKKIKKSDESKALESDSITVKKRKREQPEENIGLESNNIDANKKKRKKVQPEENIGSENNNITDKKKKRKKKHTEEINNAGDKKIKKKNKKPKKEEKDLSEKDLQKIEKKKQKKIKQLLKKKQFKQKLNEQKNALENEIEKFNETQNTEEIVTIPDSEISKNGNEKIKKKIKTDTTAVKNKKVKQVNGESQRRKPNLPHKMFVNGKELEIAYVEGFPVKKEDGDRLKQLRREMISKGLPRSEINRALKLERRRAEKALAREKKKVCFNCRNSGHNLSECPELGKDQLVETTGSGICFKCGSAEHTHFECKVVKTQEYKFAQCFICNEQGHIARQCPDNARGLYPKGGACRVCGDVTHLKKDCPQYQVQQQNEETSFKLDTLGNHNPEFIDSPSDTKIATNTKKQNKTIKFV